MDLFVEKHAAKFEERHTELSLLSAKTGTNKSSCALVYENQYFLPKLNLCYDSFTGIYKCSESFCATLTTFFYESSCYGVYYTPAENTDNGFGMCRCWPDSAWSITRYHSG